MSLAMALHCSCDSVSKAVCMPYPSPVSGHEYASLRPAVGVCGG